MSEDELRNLFSRYGEIESLKMHPPGAETQKLYAFVCFKKPDEASSAKEGLTINDKTLTINHYEIKEIRELQNEASRDKHDFQVFRQQHSQNAKWTDLANQEEMQYYLKMLLESMPFLMKQQQGPNMRQMGGPHQQRFPGGPRPQGRPQRNQMDNRRGGNMMHQNPQQNMMIPNQMQSQPPAQQ